MALLHCTELPCQSNSMGGALATSHLLLCQCLSFLMWRSFLALFIHCGYHCPDILFICTDLCLHENVNISVPFNIIIDVFCMLLIFSITQV